MKYLKRFRELSIAMIIMSSIVNAILIPTLIKTKSGLTSVTGTVLSQGHYHKPAGVRRSGVDAATIYVNGYINFAILDDKTRAYSYLSNNNVVGRQATVLYDPKGYNATENMTMHVYSLSIDGNEILTMAEAKHSNLIGFIIIGSFELIFIGVLLYTSSQIKRQRLTNTAIEKQI